MGIFTPWDEQESYSPKSSYVVSDGDSLWPLVLLSGFCCLLAFLYTIMCGR
jgi:hypothetical protein